jgi:hypothetical protein
MATQLSVLKENFNAGEFGERMATRVQFDKYVNAGAIYQNILPLPQGGYTYRPGARYIAAAKSASVKPHIISFIYSTTQAYILELGETALRFFKDQAQISVANTAAAITNGTFASNITGWTDNSSGSGAIAHDSTNQDMNITSVGAGNLGQATQAVTCTADIEHVVAFKVTGAPGDSITVRVGSASGGASKDYFSDAKKAVGWHLIQFTPTSTTFHITFSNTTLNTIVGVDDVSVLDDTPLEITTPWSESSLPDLGFAQSADVMYFCLGGATRIYRLERYGHSTWSLVKVLFEDGPFLDQNTTATTLAISATSGRGKTATASAITGINDDAGFRATDVGRLIRWKDAASDWTWFQITAFTDTTHVTIDILGPDASATTATAAWRLGEWNDTDGWPTVVGFIQQRLGFAATALQPQKFWLSKSADIERFADTDADGDVQDDSSINYRFAALRVNTIRWMASRKKPVIGTQGGNWTLRSDNAAVLTPTDIAADFEVSGGVALIQPVEVRSRLLFINAEKRKVLEFADVLQESGVQGFDSFDLTLLNDRILQGGVTQLSYAQEPDSLLWTVRLDGQVPTLTYQPDQSVIGWARQILGGSFQGGAAIVDSVASIPGQDGTGQFKDSTSRYEVWLAVKRVVNGSTVRYIECIEKVFNGDEDLQEEAFYVDSGLTLDNPITITGATKANPIVVTAPANSLSDGGLVRIVRVKGMTELNSNTYRVLEQATNTVELFEQDGTAITAASRANPGQITATSHGLSTGDEVGFFGVGGMTELNGNGYTITVVDANNFTIGVNTSGFTAFTTGGTVYKAISSSSFTAYASSGEMRLLVSSISGLDHLEAEEVKVFADGAVQTDKTVSSGSITLDTAASMVHVGLEYEKRWKSLKLAFSSDAGTAVGTQKNIADVVLVLLEAAEGSVSIATEDSAGENTFTELDLRSATQIDGDPVPFFTGEKNLGIAAGFDTDLRLILKSTAPVPATILGIVPELETA